MYLILKEKLKKMHGDVATKVVSDMTFVLHWIVILLLDRIKNPVDGNCHYLLVGAPTP